MTKKKEEHIPVCQCIGIDVSKRKFTASLFMTDRAGWDYHTGSTDFANDKTGFNQLIKWSRKTASTSVPVKFLMEATGVYYESLALHLSKLGMTVYVVLPNKAKKFAEYQGIKTKTDSVDSYALAWMGCSDIRLKPWTAPSLTIRSLKQMVRMEQALTKHKIAIKGQLEGLRHSANPEKSVISVWEALTRHIDEEIKKNIKRMKALIRQDADMEKKMKCLESIPGIGFRTAVAIVAETNGFSLCTSRKQLASYAGLDVPARQSGEVDGKRSISKKGNRRIRAILYMPAVSTLKHDEGFQTFYQRISEKNSGAGKIGIVAIERKLLLLMYTLWKKGEVYSTDTVDPSSENREC